jgi:ABC-2 type transport system permease protein
MVRKLAAYARAHWGAILEYRMSILIWMTSGMLPLVMMAVWLTLAASGPVGGYSSSDFIAYYLAAILMRQMTAVWVSYELDRQIRLGELSPLLLRPMNPFFDHMMINLADKLFRLPLLLPPLALAAWLVPGQQYHLTPLNVGLAVVSALAAWALLFVSNYAIGLLAFWTSQTQAISELWYGVRMMLSGVLAPLSLFPPAVAQVAQVLPFRFMLSFPIEILLGQLTPRQLVEGLVWQVGWLAIFVAALVAIWRRGLRAYSAVGA